MNGMPPIGEQTNVSAVDPDSDSKLKKRKSQVKLKSINFKLSSTSSSVETVGSTSKTLKEKHVDISAEKQVSTHKVKEVEKPFGEKRKEKKEISLSSSKNQIKKSKNSSSVSHPEERKEKITAKQVKKLLKDPQTIKGSKITEVVLFIVQPAYSILHPLCKKSLSEENIEFLSDYIKWSKLNPQNDDPLYIAGLDMLMNTYIQDNSSQKTTKVDFLKTKIINIEGDYRLSIIEAFLQKDFAKVHKSLEAIIPIIVSLLWNNVFHLAILDPDMLKKILKCL